MTGSQARALGWAISTLALSPSPRPLWPSPGKSYFDNVKPSNGAPSSRARPCACRRAKMLPRAGFTWRLSRISRQQWKMRAAPLVIGSCVPPETTRIELVRAFTRYARAHRGDLALRATALVIPALSAAFPCREPRASETR